MGNQIDGPSSPRQGQRGPRIARLAGRYLAGSLGEDAEARRAQHVTVTVVIYNTVAGGVPGFEDVAAAIADMDALYASCGWTGALASQGADFMKSELTVADALKIADKMAAQPYKPNSLAPQGGDIFPTAYSL